MPRREPIIIFSFASFIKKIFSENETSTKTNQQINRNNKLQDQKKDQKIKKENQKINKKEKEKRATINKKRKKSNNQQKKKKEQKSTKKEKRAKINKMATLSTSSQSLRSLPPPPVMTNAPGSLLSSLFNNTNISKPSEQKGSVNDCPPSFQLDRLRVYFNDKELIKQLDAESRQEKKEEKDSEAKKMYRAAKKRIADWEREARPFLEALPEQKLVSANGIDVIQCSVREYTEKVSPEGAAVLIADILFKCAERKKIMVAPGFDLDVLAVQLARKAFDKKSYPKYNSTVIMTKQIIPSVPTTKPSRKRTTTSITPEEEADANKKRRNEKQENKMRKESRGEDYCDDDLPSGAEL
jgi:hypothetical protein